MWSRLPESTLAPSGENATDENSDCTSTVRMSSPVRASHILNDLPYFGRENAGAIR